jgi:hypothetical protein
MRRMVSRFHDSNMYYYLHHLNMQGFMDLLQRLEAFAIAFYTVRDGVRIKVLLQRNAIIHTPRYMCN